jgi:hypothetical protein
VGVEDEGTLSGLPIDGNGPPAGVCTVEAGRRSASWTPIKEDKQRLGCGVVIGRLINSPYPGLSRSQGEPVKVAPCVEKIGVLFESTKSRLWPGLGPQGVWISGQNYSPKTNYQNGDRLFHFGRIQAEFFYSEFFHNVLQDFGLKIEIQSRYRG